MPEPRLTANIAELETQIRNNAVNTPLPAVNVTVSTATGYALADRFDLDPHSHSGRQLTFRLANPAPVIEMLRSERPNVDVPLRRAINLFISNFNTAEREQTQAHQRSATYEHSELLRKLQDTMKDYNFINRIIEGELPTFTTRRRTDTSIETVVQVTPYNKTLTAIGHLLIDPNTLELDVRFFMASNSPAISSVVRGDWSSPEWTVTISDSTLTFDAKAKSAIQQFTTFAKVELAKKVVELVDQLRGYGYTVDTTIPTEELVSQAEVA